MFGQKKQFETAIKNGRSSGGFYQATVANDKAVKETDVLEYASKNNYLLRNITYQIVNRFGDKFKGVKSFDFLPVSEIPQVVYETKFRSGVTYNKLIGSNKANVFYWTNTAMFKNYSGFYWSGNVSQGFVQGEGVGLFYDENRKFALFFKGNFQNGVLQGNGSFAAYSYSDINNFDKGSYSNEDIHLNNTFNDDMAVLTVDGKKGFIGKDMKEGFYPKYKTVIQEFSNGKAIVLNDDNKEIVINKVGSFLAYSDRQIQIDEQRRREEEERRRIAIENEIKRIKEEYAAIENSNDEIKLLTFHSKYKNSEYQFAKDNAEFAYSVAVLLSYKNLEPYNNELSYDQGNTLVKIILRTNDGSPIALKINSIYNFIDESYSTYGINTWLGKITTGSRNEKLFSSIRKPVAFLDKAVINAFWYREGTERKSESWDYTQNSGFVPFKNETLANFAFNNNLIVEYCQYRGSFGDDQRKWEQERASLQRYQQQQCDNCIIDPKKSTMPKVDKDLFGTYEKDGVIVMKNGNEFKWYYSKKGFTVNGPSWLRSSDDGFASWDLMIEDLKQKCSINNRCE